jgi:hypothetical protein
MSLTQLPNAGILGPIPEGFDFKKCKVVPDAIACLEHPLSSCLSFNQEIKIFNNKGVTATVKEKLTAIPHPADLNVGPPLKATYLLTEDKLNNLVASKALCSAYAPLPLGLLWLIILEHALKKKSRDTEKSGQHLSLSICKVLVPWLQHHPNNRVHFHHITAGVELEDHQLAHILATSTCVKVGSAPVISADFARCRAVTQMLKGWNSLFQSKRYIGLNFLTL